MTKSKIHEVIFWQVKGHDQVQIASRLKLPLESVKAALWGYKSKHPGIVAKFKRWLDIPVASVGRYEKTDFVKSNDLSFHEQLKLAGVGKVRIKRSNRNYNC